MTPIFLNPPPSPFHHLAEGDHEDHTQHLIFPSPSQATSSTSSSHLSFPIFFNSKTQDHEAGGSIYDHMDHEQHQVEVNKYYLHGGSSTIDQHEFLPISHDPAVLPTHVENHVETDDHEGNNYGGLKFTITCKQEEIKNENQAENGGPVKWMSSKMRLMRKMMSSDPDRRQRMVIDTTTTQKSQDQHQPISPNSSNSNNNTIRVCSDCNTTKTPLWRSGPRGPKSLCNACGIRQRKARRAMAAAAAAAANGAILATSTTSTSDASSMKTNKVQQYKKRCKITAPRSKKKICFEDLTINLSKSSAFHQVFPQDEKEAAILLMALSCGLVHG